MSTASRQPSSHFTGGPVSTELSQSIPSHSSTPPLSVPSLSPGEMGAAIIRGRDHCLSLQLSLPSADAGPGCPLSDVCLLACGHAVTAAAMTAYFLFSVHQVHGITQCFSCSFVDISRSACSALSHSFTPGGGGPTNSRTLPCITPKGFWYS